MRLYESAARRSRRASVDGKYPKGLLASLFLSSRRLGTHPHQHVGRPPRRSPVKMLKLRQLVEAAIAVCEPENVEEKAAEHTRLVLFKRFGAILYPGKRFF